MEYILVSHGPFAKAALASAEMIVGKQEGIAALEVDYDTTLEGMVKEIIGEVHGKDLSKVIIFCDILGGTPSNASLKVLNDFPELTIVTGFNLPMLIESLISKEKGKKELLELLSEVHEQSLTVIDSATLDTSDTTLDEETECYDL